MKNPKVPKRKTPGPPPPPPKPDDMEDYFGFLSWHLVNILGILVGIVLSVLRLKGKI